MTHVHDLGWSRFFADQLPSPLDESTRVARVVGEGKHLFHLRTRGGDEFVAALAGALRPGRDGPGRPAAVGDWVLATGAPPEARITRVLARRNALTRTAAGSRGEPQLMATNVDRAWVVTSANAELEPRRVERYLALFWEAGVRPGVLVTKLDEARAPDALLGELAAVAPGAPVLGVSALTGAGMDDLREHLAPGETTMLLGSSGVGKSTLVNALAGAEVLATSAVRAGDAKGRHTTTARHLVPLPGGATVIDSPGMRELGLAAASSTGLDRAFAEIADLVARCRFRDCSHTREPGCAILAALEDGTLDPARLASYEKLQRELEYRAARAARRERRAGRRRR